MISFFFFFFLTPSCPPTHAHPFFSLLLLCCFISEHKCNFPPSNPLIFFPSSLHLTTRSSSSSVSCTAHTVSRSKIWLYHHISIPAPACSVAWYWFLPNWCRRPEIAPAVNFIGAVFLFVKKTFMHCSAVSVLPHPAMIICLRDVHTSESPLIFSFFYTSMKYLFSCYLLGCFLFAYYKCDICNLSYKVWITVFKGKSSQC